MVEAEAAAMDAADVQLTSHEAEVTHVIVEGKLFVPAPFHDVPTPMLLQCPECKQQHIDVPDDSCKNCGNTYRTASHHVTVENSGACCAHPEKWDNPPHKTHRCKFCGHKWRPFPFPSFGVTEEEIRKFWSQLSDKDWDEALSMANEMVNSPEAKTAAIVELVQSSGFKKIGLQMNLWARFLREPADQVDHIRLAFIDTNGAQFGDSIPWDQFLSSVMQLCGVEAARADLLITAFKNDYPITIEMDPGDKYKLEAVPLADIDAEARDPVHEENGKWYFWEETWADRQGPFDTELQARNACEQYAQALVGDATRGWLETLQKITRDGSRSAGQIVPIRKPSTPQD
jgi:hypothetical protein